jgi:hypothetical protein
LIAAQGGELSCARTFEKERPVEHWAYFPNPDSRRTFIGEATKLGYTTETLIEPKANKDRYGVRLSCIGLPSLENIDDLTLLLFRAARDYGGEYDGWETQVVR